MNHSLALFLFDPVHGNLNYILYVMAPGLILALWAQARMKSAYARASKMPAASGLTGAQAATEILGRSGLEGVGVEESRGGVLSDHYDPRHRVLRLSHDVYHGRSLAALGVAAHEAGHALQHAVGYAPLALRNKIVPLASIGSNLGILLLVIGVAMNVMGLALVGVAFFALTVVFQLVNLPCEFNASSRAREQLLTLGLVQADEDRIVKSVLAAAAWTYVAALVVAVLQLLYYMWRMGLLGGRRN